MALIVTGTSINRHHLFVLSLTDIVKLLPHAGKSKTTVIKVEWMPMSTFTLNIVKNIIKLEYHA